MRPICRLPPAVVALLVVNLAQYRWSNQQETAFLAKAMYNGSLASFLKGFFP